MVLGLDDEWTSMPVVGPEAKSPPEPLRFPAVWLSSRALEAGDRRADAGRSRGVLLDAVGYAPLAYREWVAKRAARRRKRDGSYTWALWLAPEIRWGFRPRHPP
jgi:hypothetical protein